MTVASTNSKAGPYAGAGTTGPFAVDFRFLEDSHLQVIRTSTSGVATTLTLTTDYTVTGAGGTSGEVTLVAALAVGETLTVLRSVPATQETDYVQNDAFPAESHERALDKLTMIAQQQSEILSRAITVPTGEPSVPALPAAADRANTLMGFDANGAPIVTTPGAGSAEGVALDLAQFIASVASFASAADGAGRMGFAYGLPYAMGTAGNAAAAQEGIDVTQRPFLADNTGAVSCSAAVAAAIAAFPGIPLRFPAGTYRFDTEVAYVPTITGTFGPGLKITGDGPLLTKFDNRVAGGALFRCATVTANTFQHTVCFRGFSILQTTAPANSIGISLRSCYNVSIEDVWINGMSADGLKVIVTLGDQDACNMVKLVRSRIENCGGWGINTEVTGTHNEFSFLALEHTFIQANGTASAVVPPPTGGIRWKGQILKIAASAFTLNQNVGLYVQGGGGLANTVEIDTTAFENNVKRHVYCDGADGFTMRRCQLYSNNSYVVQKAVEFSGASFLVRNVTIDGTLVRASSANNAYTAFTVSGANALMDTIRVRGTAWGDFDYAGQSRFSGIQFDPVPKQCAMLVLNATTVSLRPELGGAVAGGNKMPLRLRGGGGGVPSTTGEWVATQIGNAGITITNSGLAVNTRYYVYLYDNNGVPSLELSTTADAVDSATGYSVKTGDATRLYLGSVHTAPATTDFMTTASGWLNPLPIPSVQPGVSYWLFGSAAGPRIKSGFPKPTSDTDGTLI